MCSCTQPEVDFGGKLTNFYTGKTYLYYKCKHCGHIIYHYKLIHKDYSIEKEIKEIIAKGEYEDYFVTGIYKKYDSRLHELYGDSFRE